jgi:chorismate mutase
MKLPDDCEDLPDIRATIDALDREIVAAPRRVRKGRCAL